MVFSETYGNPAKRDKKMGKCVSQKLAGREKKKESVQSSFFDGFASREEREREGGGGEREREREEGEREREKREREREKREKMSQSSLSLFFLPHQGKRIPGISSSLFSLISLSSWDGCCLRRR